MYLKWAFAHDKIELKIINKKYLFLANPEPKPFFNENNGSSKIWRLPATTTLVLLNLIPLVFGLKRRDLAPFSYPGLLDLTL